MKQSKAVLTVLIFLFIPFILMAEDGTLHLMKGYVKLQHLNMEKIYHQIGEVIPVYMGDRIQTGLDTKVKILLNEKREEILLYSKTLFKISVVNKDQTKLSLNIGKARFKVNARLKKAKLKKRRRFQVKTTTALVGVKGTEFLIGCTPAGTELLTLSGIVTLASLIDPDVTVEVTKNQVSKVLKNQPPTIPVEISEEQKQKLLQSSSPLNLIKGKIPLEGRQMLETIPMDRVSELVGENIEDITDLIETVENVELKDVQITIDFQ